MNTPTIKRRPPGAPRSYYAPRRKTRDLPDFFRRRTKGGRRIPAALLWLACLFSWVPITLGATLWSGRVVGIHDGDTLSVLRDGVAIRIRLDEIDAPEFGQDFGRQAKQQLSALCFGRIATVAEQGEDRYGRTLARVDCGAGDVNAELVRRGYAWFYQLYGRDPELRRLEERARAAGLGLWRLPDPIPPWEFRHRTPRRAPLRGAPTVFPRLWDRCQPRRHCRDFKSCAEVLTYVRRCGMDGLDRNGDGVPCQSTLCRD